MDVMETIELDLTDSEFLELAKLAHSQDVTFNQLVNNILSDAVGIDLAHQRFQHTVDQLVAINES